MVDSQFIESVYHMNAILKHTPKRTFRANHQDSSNMEKQSCFDISDCLMIRRFNSQEPNVNRLRKKWSPKQVYE